jgi:hypothetical protein
MNPTYKHVALAGASIVALAAASYFFMPIFFSVAYRSGDISKVEAAKVAAEAKAALPILKNGIPELVVVHVKTPDPLKAIYMTACVAATPSWRTRLMNLIDTTELNSVVIDIKDYSGTVSYFPTDPKLPQGTGSGCRVKDMAKFVAELHDKNIYVIGRVTVFQDPYYTKLHPELAVKRASDGGVWKDRKGLAFIDVSAKPYWEYIAELARDSYAIGFDEINFDYVRFPSDGNMKDIAYPWTGKMSKSLALEHFFEFLEQVVKPTGAVISVDLFGMTTTNFDDLNIGQVLETAMAHFDFVAPMVYPSHYPPNFNGWKNPNNYPYDLIKFVMTKGSLRAEATSTPSITLDGIRIGTTTPALYTKTAYNRNKLRPWLQDFQYGGHYGPAEVRAQIKATYDSGLNSWMLWDPGNKYTPAALNAS